MSAAELEIIKRTELADHVVVVTAQRANPNLIRPFTTFTITDSNPHAEHVTDFASEAAALAEHEGLVRNNKTNRRTR
jgi:hypothetical protein